MLFMPLNLHLYIDARNASVHSNVLHEGRILEMVFHAQDGAKRAALDEADFVRAVKVPMLFFKVRVDVPCVPALGLIDEGLQQVAADGICRAAAVGFRGGQRFGAAAFIEEAGKAAGLWIDGEADEVVFKCVRRSMDGSVILRGAACAANEI